MKFEKGSIMLSACTASISKKMGKNDLEKGVAIARFLFPGALLLSGMALRDYPLTATTCTTAFACLAIGADIKTGHELRSLPIGTALLLSAIPLSIYRAWNSTTPACWGYAANGLVASAWVGFYTYLWTQDRHIDKEMLASQLSNLLFPVICYAIQKAAPSSLATVGIGATVLGALYFSHTQNDKIELQSIAYGTAFALVPTAVVGAWKSANWSDQLLYSGGALINLTPLILTPIAIYQKVQKKP